MISFKGFVLQKAQEEHKRLLKGGPFRLNLYPQEYFDTNPYFNDKPLPPVKKLPPQKPSAPPFLPSSPAKKVSLPYIYPDRRQLLMYFLLKALLTVHKAEIHFGGCYQFLILLTGRYFSFYFVLSLQSSEILFDTATADQFHIT